MKSKGEAFSCHKQRRKVPLVHSQPKQHQDRCGPAKKPQNARIKLLTGKQATTNLQLIFLNVKMLKKLHQLCFQRL